MPYPRKERGHYAPSYATKRSSHHALPRSDSERKLHSKSLRWEDCEADAIRREANHDEPVRGEEASDRSFEVAFLHGPLWAE